MRVFILIAVFACCLQAQSYAQGTITITQDPKIEQLRSLHAWYNNQPDTRIPGFQVVAMTTTDRTQATNAKIKLLRQFPSMKVDMNYDQEPYYRVTVGAYRSRLQAETLRHKMKQTFPTAFIGINRNLKPADFRPANQ